MGSTAVTRESADMRLTCYWRVWWQGADAVSGWPSSQLLTLARINALDRPHNLRKARAGRTVLPDEYVEKLRKKATRGGAG
jgi:hypothetical protein